MSQLAEQLIVQGGAGMSTSLEKIEAEILGLRVLMEAFVLALKPAAQSRPLTAEELIRRWAVAGKTTTEQLHNLASLCRDRGLQKMKGTRGISATYMVADVIAAEAYASGKTSRRRRAA
jgi:hypothetical protein